MKNIVIMEKDCDNEKDYDDWNLSNTHGVIKTVLNFFTKIFYSHKKQKNVK